nr:dihydropyrimidinase [Quercus suber]
MWLNASACIPGALDLMTDLLHNLQYKTMDYGFHMTITKWDEVVSKEMEIMVKEKVFMYVPTYRYKLFQVLQKQRVESRELRVEISFPIRSPFPLLFSSTELSPLLTGESFSWTGLVWIGWSSMRKLRRLEKEHTAWFIRLVTG